MSPAASGLAGPCRLFSLSELALKAEGVSPILQQTGEFLLCVTNHRETPQATSPQSLQVSPTGVGPGQLLLLDVLIGVGKGEGLYV